MRHWNRILLALLAGCALQGASGAASLTLLRAPASDVGGGASHSRGDPAPVSADASATLLPQTMSGGEPPPYALTALPPAFDPPARRGLREPAAPRAPPLAGLPLYLTTQRLRI